MQDFESKRKALFACLDDASKDIRGTRLEQRGLDAYTVSTIRGTASSEDESSSLTPLDKSLVNFLGKESLFKKPELPIGKCLGPRKTPDFQVNPHKWKKYSLLDVDISDKMNTSAALKFLKEIEDKNAATENAETSAPMEKVVFKKSSILKRNIREACDDEPNCEGEKPKLKGSTLIMPEYVVGQKTASDKKKRRLSNRGDKTQNKKELTLSHLQEEDTIDDEDG